MLASADGACRLACGAMGTVEATWSEERTRRRRTRDRALLSDAGPRGAPPILLVMGIGAQLVTWPDGFCELLAGRGYRLIRFDNRDVGRSTWLTELGRPSVTKAWEKRLDDPPYLFTDMAADCAGLLDALGIESAHIVGASLGGFVAQTIAFEHPGRVRSLASVMSSSGSGRVGQPHPAALEVLMTAPPEELDAYVENIVAARRVIGSTGIRAGRGLGARDGAPRVRARPQPGGDPAPARRLDLLGRPDAAAAARSRRRPSFSTGRRTR